MEFRVLGPIELWSAGIRKELGSAKERLLLAVLLLAEGRPVTVETLIDRVWGESPPAEVRQSLQTDLYRLRRRLKTQGVAGETAVVARPGAYALETAPEHVDLFRSRALRERAANCRRNGKTREAAELLREAVTMWRAEPLTGIAGEWVEQTRTSLDSDYRAMARELVDAEFANGEHAEIIGFLVDLIGRYPFDESFAGRLMIAYYHCGRQVDSIALYQSTTERLRREAGTAPSPQLQTVYRNIRRHDPSIASPRRPAAEAVPGLDRLPPAAGEFTGRRADTLALSAESPGRVVIIEGMPGVGKTALAVRAARELAGRFPDGCLFLSLHGHDARRPPETPAAALSSLLTGMGVVPTRVPHGHAERVRLWRETTAGRRVLVVLDDAADEAQVRSLLPGSPGCQVFITSRRHLGGIDGAIHHRLDPLPEDDGAALFRRIVGTVRPAPDEAVAAVVRLCGGLPREIRIAATRLRDDLQVTSIDALVEELRRPQDDIPDLQDPAFGLSLELSYRDLTPAQRHLLRRLALSPTLDLTAPVVAVLAETPVEEARRDLAELVDHHLLDEPVPGRFLLHTLIKRYVRARAKREDPAADRRRSVGRTLDFYLLRTDLADRILFPYHARTDIMAADRRVVVDAFEDEESAKSWLAAEGKNLVRLVRYAADREWPAHAVDLAKTMARYFDSASRWEEAEIVHRRALNVALELDLPRATAQAHFDLSVVQWRRGQTDEALANATKAKQIAHRMGDAALKAAAQDQIGLVAWTSAKYREALAYSGEALDIYRQIGDTHGKADCLNHLGMMLAQTGRHQDALRSFHQALDICHAIGDARSEATTLSNLAHTYLLLGYHRDAYELYHKSREIYRTLPGRRNNAILQNNIGDVARYRGRYEVAIKHYAEALAEFSTTGDRINESNTLNNIGLALSGMEQWEEARNRHRSAMAIAKSINSTGEKIRAVLGLADVDAGTGRYPAAADGYRAARRLARQVDDPHLEAQAVSGIAHVTNLTKGHDAARIYWRQAFDLFSQLNIVPEIEAVRLRLEIVDLVDS